MKKIMLGIALIAMGVCARAQNGLESIIVEKYYVSNAADAAGSVGTLPVGSVTYRIFADMLPGYKFQAAYGVPGHTLTLSTSTTFFNNEDRGAVAPTYSKTNAAANSVMIDSWLSVGAGCAGNFGILKTEDNGVATVAHASILQNNDASAGIPLTTQDGLIAGTPEAVTFVGLTTELDVLDATSQAGNLFQTSNGSWASLNGSTGPAANNKVLIAQITTDGVFHYELNIQIGTPVGGTQNFVASSPVGAEISIPSLTGTLGAPNVLPTVSMTAPANNSTYITGAVVAMAATAADADGTVSQVEFFVSGTSVGIDNTAPYTMNWTSTVGTKYLTAVATDNNGGATTSARDTIFVVNNPPPTVVITTPTSGSNFTAGANVAIAATASDDVSVTSVEFFVDGGTSLGIDNTAPYTANYVAVAGSHTLTARATDNLGAQTTSAGIPISVGANAPPVISITSPTNGSSIYAPSVVIISVNATDADGTLQYVQFYVNGISIGTDGTAPYVLNWTSVAGTAVITARAVDNLFAQTYSSPVTITVVDPNAPPYKVVTTSATCVSSIFCEPVAAADTVTSVIGYDMVFHYDKTKVIPTGNITIYNALINPSYVDIASSLADTANGNISVSLYFNASAPPNTKFQGVGNLCCVEFTKTASFSSVDTAIFTVPTLQESYFSSVATKLVSQGNYITYKDTTFKGTLLFWADNSPLKYNSAIPDQYLITNIYGNNVACNSRSATAVNPDLSGSFDYSTNKGVDINIERDIAGTTSVQPVINGFDAFLTRKVLINDISFIPSVYQIIAMDVNLDGVVSAGDLSQINQRTVLMIPEFKQAWNYDTAGVSNGSPSKDWMFVDATRLGTNSAYRISTTYPLNDGVGFSKARVPQTPFCLPLPISNAATCPLISSDSYKGILLGDVNGSFATAGISDEIRQSANNKVIFDLSKASANGNFIDIPVSYISEEIVNALDFSMQFEEANLSFVSVTDNAQYLETLTNYSEDKTLRVTSSSLQNYESGKSLMSVRFAMNSGKINASDLTAIKAYLNGEQVGVEVRLAGVTSDNNVLVNIYPNPTNGTLNVLTNEDATIQLLGVDGRLVISETNVNANQKQELNIQNLGEGIYMMKIFNNNFVSMKRVIVQK